VLHRRWIFWRESKITAPDYPMRASQSAQALIRLLVRHERYTEAVEMSLEHLPGQANGYSAP
jgi:hypothetical protein